MKALKALFVLFLITGCKGEKKADIIETVSTPRPRYLYVATGACYSGNGITTYSNTTASNIVFRVDLETGVRDQIIADYYSSPSNAGDSPVSIADYDDTRILVLVENTTTPSLRRIELVEKKNFGARSTYSNNTAALSAQLRKMIKLSDNYLLISKSTAIEKQKEGANRLTVGVNAWVTLSAPASACTTSATLLTSMAQLSNGLLAFSHAAAGTARIGLVSALGYSTALDCKAGQSSPNVNSFPTAMFYDSANQKLIVSYGGASTGADLNTMYAYTINETAGTISSPQEIYDSNLFGSTYGYLLFGASAIAYDTVKKNIYLATAINTATTVTNYKIEKLAYDATQIGVSNAAVLTPSATTFYPYGSDTKCISDMMIAY